MLFKKLPKLPSPHDETSIWYLEMVVGIPTFSIMVFQNQVDASSLLIENHIGSGSFVNLSIEFVTHHLLFEENHTFLYLQPWKQLKEFIYVDRVHYSTSSYKSKDNICIDRLKSAYDIPREEKNQSHKNSDSKVKFSVIDIP